MRVIDDLGGLLTVVRIDELAPHVDVMQHYGELDGHHVILLHSLLHKQHHNQHLEYTVTYHKTYEYTIS